MRVIPCFKLVEDVQKVPSRFKRLTKTIHSITEIKKFQVSFPNQCYDGNWRLDPYNITDNGVKAYKILDASPRNKASPSSFRRVLKIFHIEPSHRPLKRIGVSGQLVPFFKAVCVYFAMGAATPSPTAAAVKCAPIICLLIFVSLKAGSSPGERGRYARWVCAGLTLSALGDAALVWPQLLLIGMILFGAAHIAYIMAFGLRPRASALAAVAALAAALYVRTFRPGALAPLTPFVHVYAALLAAMAWRGAARPGPQRAGAILFAFSDAVLGYNLFGGPATHKQSEYGSQVVVMSTYYLGQLLIALSALQQPEGVSTPQ